MSYPKNDLRQELMLALISLMSMGILYYYGSAFKPELITCLVIAGIILILQLIRQKHLDNSIYVHILDYITTHFYRNFVVSLIIYALFAVLIYFFPILIIMLLVIDSVFLTCYPWSVFVTRCVVTDNRDNYSDYLHHDKCNGLGTFLGACGIGLLWLLGALAIIGIGIVVVYLIVGAFMVVAVVFLGILFVAFIVGCIIFALSLV